MSVHTLINFTRLIQRGQSERVIHFLAPLAKKKSSHVALRSVLAHAYEMAGKKEEAEIAWIHARMAMPRQAPVETGSGIPAADLELGEDFEEALRTIMAPEEDLDNPDTLQRLIDELRSQRTGVPQELDDVFQPDFDDDDIDGIVSETLARIYATQHKYADAADMYDQLVKVYPDEADRYHQLADKMRGLIDTVTSS